MARRQTRTTGEQTEQIRDVLVETAQTELAAVNAGIAFWSAWVESATKFSGEATRVLAAIASGEEPSDDGLGSLVDSSRQFIREMAELPERTAHRFNSELEKLTSSERKGARKRQSPRKATRRAKVKP